MIEMRRRQLGFGDGLIAEEVSDLREGWMTYADEVLADEEIVAIVYEALGKRRPKSRSRGRRGTPAEVVLRLLTLKHVLPLVLATGAGAEMRQALGTAVFFGMLGVTLFGLLFTPVFYVLVRAMAGGGKRKQSAQPSPAAGSQATE